MKHRPWNTREKARFTQIATFHRLPFSKEFSPGEVVFMGVPWDSGTTYRPGARFGPRALRDISSLSKEVVPSLEMEVFDVLGAVDYGDLQVDPLNFNKSLENIETEVSNVLELGGIPALMGGDHLISLPAVRAAAKKHGPLRIIHLDAHTDLADQAWGQKIHHGTWVRRAFEEGLIEEVIQLGIRGPYTSAREIEELSNFNVDIWCMDRLYDFRMRIGEHIKASDTPVYITLDIDGVDPAFAPGTGTPVPGGLSSYEVLFLLRQLDHVGPIIGFDLVEVSPCFDNQNITALLGINLSSTILGMIAKQKRKALNIYEESQYQQTQ